MLVPLVFDVVLVDPDLPLAGRIDHDHLIRGQEIAEDVDE